MDSESSIRFGLEMRLPLSEIELKTRLPMRLEFFEFPITPHNQNYYIHNLGSLGSVNFDGITHFQPLSFSLLNHTLLSK